MLPQLISQGLHQKDGFPCIDAASVHQHARWLINNHQHVIEVTDL